MWHEPDPCTTSGRGVSQTVARIAPKPSWSGGFEDQALQVVRLGEGEWNGVIGGLAEAADDAQLATGVERGAGHDLLEQGPVHAGAARERRQDPTRREE